MKMRALITGGAGFVGANLVRALIKKNHEVALLLREESKPWRIKDILNHITPLYSDLTDKENLARVIKQYRPDMIYHLAVYGAYPKNQKELRLMIETNIIGSINLSEAAGDTPIINTSSNSEYGIKNTAMKEENVCQPDNYYAWSKLSQTLYFQLRRAVILRLFHAYGPWEEPTRLIPVLIKSKIKNLPVKLINSVRDYIYIDDVTEAFIRATEKHEKLKGEIINIGTGQQTSVKQLLDILDKINPSKLNISWSYEPVQTEPKDWYAHINKAKAVLGWSPQYDLEQGISETYNWWEEYLGRK